MSSWIIDYQILFIISARLVYQKGAGISSTILVLYHLSVDTVLKDHWWQLVDFLHFDPMAPDSKAEPSTSGPHKPHHGHHWDSK